MQAAVHRVVVPHALALREVAGHAARAFGERARDRQHGRVQSARRRRERVVAIFGPRLVVRRRGRGVGWRGRGVVIIRHWHCAVVGRWRIRAVVARHGHGLESVVLGRRDLRRCRIVARRRVRLHREDRGRILDRFW